MVTTAIVVISFALYTDTSLEGLDLFIAWPLPVVTAILWLVHRVIDDGKLQSHVRSLDAFLQESAKKRRR